MSEQAQLGEPLSPWLVRQLDQLRQHSGHALLLQGPSGLGHYALGLALASAWLCLAPSSTGACGRCASCHAIAVRTHADLRVLMPETALLALEWPLDESAQKDIDDKKRKPSREIRVEAARDLITFTQRTAAGDRGKVVLIFPADRMNGITANTLLKTLEEPAGDTRFILASQAPHLLLPTIRSRCISHTLLSPQTREGIAWLMAQGMTETQAQVMMRAAGGRPEDAWRMTQRGWTPERWAALPQALRKGETEVLQDVTGGELVEVLQKLCHDLMAVCVGGSPRYFDAALLPVNASLSSLSDWSVALRQRARVAEHPFQAGLMLEALASQARQVLNAHS